MDSNKLIFPQSATEFFNFYWEKEGVVLHLEQDLLLVNKDEVFEILLDACDEYKNAGSFNSLKMYLNSKQLSQNIKSLLPNRNDINFSNYVQRLDDVTNNAEFLIYINSIEKYNYNLWHKLHKFMDIIFSHVGLPKGPVEIELFFGRYSKTPGGIHRDFSANFHFVIDGIKLFYTWPHEAAMMADKESHQPVQQSVVSNEQYLDDKEISWQASYRKDHIAKAGEVIFCPSQHWHVGYSPEVCVCINIAIYLEGAALEIFQQAMKKFVYSNNITGDTVNDEMKQLLDNFKSVRDDKNFYDYINQLSLARETAMGFRTSMKLLDPCSTSTLLDNHWQRNPLSIIRWFVNDKAEILYFANGHCKVVFHHPAIIWLLEIVSGSNSFNISNLVNNYFSLNQQKDTETYIRELFIVLLSDLYQKGAVMAN